MDAAAESAFDALAAAASRRLWPGQVRIDGQTYDVALVRGERSVRWREGDQAGRVMVETLSVELAKADHPAEPALDLLVEDLSSGRLYRLSRLGGRAPTDTVWMLDCVSDERA